MRVLEGLHPDRIGRAVRGSASQVSPSLPPSAREGAGSGSLAADQGLAATALDRAQAPDTGAA